MYCAREKFDYYLNSLIIWCGSSCNWTKCVDSCDQRYSSTCVYRYSSIFLLRHLSQIN